MSVNRRGFLKKMFGAGIFAAGFSSKKIDAGNNVPKYSVSNDGKVDLNHVWKKLQLNEELNVDECEILFNYYVSVWYDFNFPKVSIKVNYYQKKKIIKEKLDKNGYTFILGLLYMGISRSNYYREDGFVLKPTFEMLLDNLKVERGLLKKNFLEDLRVLFLIMRDRYYSVMVKKYLYENLNSLLGDVNSEVDWFNNKINEIKYSSLKVFHNDINVDYKNYSELIKRNILNYVYSGEDSNKLVNRLIRHVNKKGLEISDINIHQLNQVTNFSISSSLLNSKLQETINRISKKHGMNSKIVQMLCMIETSYGYNLVTSHAGARGPIQVMPKTYQRFTKKNNFDTASDEELIEAGILNLRNLMERLDIEFNETYPFTYIDLFMIGVSYNAGIDSLYNLVRKKNYKLTLEPINYHQFLYFLYSGVIEFK